MGLHGEEEMREGEAAGSGVGGAFVIGVLIESPGVEGPGEESAVTDLSRRARLRGGMLLESEVY